MAELWDDSALITAFNSAIAKYKTMHGVPCKSKVAEEKAFGKEAIASMESEYNVGEATDECEMANGELLQRDETGQQQGEGLEAKADELISLAENAPSGDAGREEAPTSVDNDYAASEYYSHQGNLASSYGCYLCQWNAYYNQAGACSSSLPFYPPHGFQCQYCGFVDKNANSTKQPSTGLNAPQPTPNVSDFPDMVRAAVVEAMKSGEGEKLTRASTDSNFSDVAVAWFMAGFHTSRYFSQGKGTN